MPHLLRSALLLAAATAVLVGGCGNKEPGRRVTGFEPKTGLASGGDAVVIKGQGFKTHGVPSVKIWFGEREGSNVRFRGDDTVVVDAPAGTAGEAVTITMVFDDSGTIELPSKFTYIKEDDALSVDALTSGKKPPPKKAPAPTE